jgi:hypothetical protein
MGTSGSAAQLAAKFDGLANTIPDMQKAAANQSALLVKTVALEHLGVAIGSDLVMSGAGKGAKLGVRYDVGKKGQAETTAYIGATGPWQLIESRNRPHLIGPKNARGVNQRGRAVRVNRSKRLAAIDSGSAMYRKTDVLHFKNGKYSRWAAHPGTRGKYPWRDSIRQVSPKLPDVWATAYRNAILSKFG